MHTGIIAQVSEKITAMPFREVKTYCSHRIVIALTIESLAMSVNPEKKQRLDSSSEEDYKFQLKCVNTIRILSADMVEKANSGHPGAPMGMAPIAHILFGQVMKFAPHKPSWSDRDRFVLSNGHACALLYAMLHLTGYDLSLDDLKAFRQLGSKTPGHPENFVTPGVEVSTGPLGQGISNAVGMAIAEKNLAATFNKDNLNIVDHYTYVLCGDGCLQEGGKLLNFLWECCYFMPSLFLSIV